VGVAGQGSGAAAGLSGAISGLAENLGLIANVAVIGGVALLTKTILTQAVAIYGSVKASMARRSADLAILQSQVQLAGIEVQRTRQVAALALTEVNLARQEYNNATTRTACAAATIRLTQAEVALALAEKQKTAATVADTVAQNANNAARSRGAMIFNAAGGWVGVLTIGVAALTAGYMYLKSRTAEANAKLEEQGKIALETDESLKKLTGNDKINAVSNLTSAFNAQNAELGKSKESVDAVLFAIRAASVENEKARKVTEDARNGVISYNQAIELLNKMDIPTDLYEMLKKQVIQYDENAEKASNSQRVLKILGVEFKLSGNAAQNSAVQFEKSTESLGKNATAADKAAKAHSEYTKTALSDIKEMAARAQMQKMGFGENQIEERLKVLKLLNFDPTLAHSQTGIEMKNLADISAKMKDSEDAKAEALKKQTDHKAKQLKITQAELEVAKRSAALIEKSGLGKYAESKGIPSSVIAGLLAQESGGIRDAKSPTGAIGYFQTTSGYRKENNLSVADSYNLEKSGKVAIDNIARVYEKTGDLAQAILSHNAGEGGASQFTKTGKVKGGAARNKEVSQYVGKVSRYADIIAGGVGKSGISEKDNDRAYQEQLKVKLDLIKQGVDLQEKYESEQAQRSKARDEEILLAQQSNQAELIPKIKERYNAQDELAKLQQDYELNGFKYTEDQKLIYQRDSAKFSLDAEGKYSDEVKALRKKAYDDLYDYEVVKSKLAKDQRLLQSTEFYMSELQLAQAKYDIERRLLTESNADPKEKAFKSQMLALQNQVDMNRRLKDASMGWDSVQSQMNGSTGRYQVNQDRFSRMGASQNLFDTQIADVENQEQEPGADLQKLAEVREKIWADHNKRMFDIENQYQKDSLNLQLTQAQQLTGSFANMFKGILGESSGAYKTMFAMQQGFAIAQAGINLYSSASKAYNESLSPTVWGRMADAAKAMLDQGTFLAMIQAITPQGFATGGHITGKGTGTSDDIPIMASNGEFMMRQYAASKIGLVALNYMNQTGEIPFQSEYLAMKSQYLGSTQPDLNVQKFKDGGLVGVSCINNTDAERSQFNSVQQTNIGSSQPKVTIINQTSQPVEATTQWDGSELQVVLKEMQKQNEAQTKSLISQSWRDAERQGGALDRIKKGR